MERREVVDSLAEMVRIFSLKDHGDQRGFSYSLPEKQLRFLGSVEDVYFSMTLPGHIRGNHFHRLRRRVLVVRFEDSWTLAWDQGEGTIPEVRSFEDAGTVAVEVEPLASIAVRNDGQRPLLFFSMTNGLYDPANPDSYGRIVLAGSRV